MDIHMDMSMDTHMEMPIKSKVSKFTALDLDLLMAVIAVCLAPAVHPIAADIILTALAVWAMRNSR